MATRRILLEDDPMLRKISKPVTIFDSNLKELIKDMISTMRKEDGAGLAGIQVGVLKRVFIVADKNETVAVINPEIIKQSGHYKSQVEGCLSLPGKVGLVDRPNEVVAKFQNENGEWVERTFVGFIAKAFCHEFDHLNGILYKDRATMMFDSYEDYDKYLKSKKKKEQK